MSPRRLTLLTCSLALVAALGVAAFKGAFGPSAGTVEAGRRDPIQTPVLASLPTRAEAAEPTIDRQPVESGTAQVPPVEVAPSPPTDVALQHLQTLIKDLEDDASPASRRYLDGDKDELGRLVDRLSLRRPTDAEMEQLRRLDEPNRLEAGRAARRATHVKLSMSAQAILDGRFDGYEVATDIETQKARLSEILNKYTGRAEDRQYLSTGGAQPLTGRVIQFFRASHPEVFLADEEVHRLRDVRRRSVEDVLRQTGNLKQK
jgi:hypothetical protein